MIKDLHQKRGPITHNKGLVQVAFSFFISAIIGVIYSFMIIDETIGGYIHKILPSREGPDLHQYLPVVITVLIYSYFNQKKKRRNVLEKSRSLVFRSSLQYKLYFFTYPIISDSATFHVNSGLT